MSSLYRLSPLEVATGIVLGTSRRTVGRSQHETPLAAVEDAIRPALERAPCYVSFSGGRDSSTVLAAATALARREGLALPIPATHRFAGAEGSGESEWQELVVAHLGLEDWLRLELSDEMDCVGPLATALLRRHGLLWPCNLHFHGPLIEAASGGSLLTGIGGDELFSASRWWRIRDVLAGRKTPRPRDATSLALALAPEAARRRFLLRRATPPPFPWLKPAALQELLAAFVVDEAAEPLGWGASLRYRVARRYLEVGSQHLAAVAGDWNVQVRHPLIDDAVVSTLSHAARRDQFRTRAEGMQLLAGTLLPEPVLSRTSKARFDGAFWHRHSRELAARWNGEGVDSDVVDVGRLREEWASPEPDARTFTLLQSVYLAGTSASGERPEQQLARSAQ